VDWLRDQVKKGLNARTFVLIAFLVGTLLWIQSLDAKQKALRARARAATTAPAVAVPARLASDDKRAAAIATVPPGWGSDPFERRVADVGEAAPAVRVSRVPGAPQPSGLYLQGIMAGPLGKTALINGTAYREGERIGSREVLQIGRRSVLILDHGTVTTLYFKGDG
jgi:hypothetical protein